MAKTAKALLQVAAKEIGYSRYNDPEQGTKYGRWYAKLTNSPYFGTTGVPFCAMFVSWCLAQLNISCTGTPTAACTSGLLAAARHAGKLLRPSEAQPGDVVLFDWSYGGYYSSNADHTGFCERNTGSSLETIEGNVGGVVARRTRPYSCIVGVIRPNFDKPAFSDVNENTAHYEDIVWLKEKGISTGYSDGTFRPLEKTARADAAAFLYRLANSPKYAPSNADKIRFKDVNAKTSHSKEVWWLGAKKISEGYSDGTFRPLDNLTRGDMAAFVYRAVGSPKYTPTNKDKTRFTDVTEKTAHCKEIWWLASKGITKGYKDNTFRPYAPILRCDVAAFLHRMSEI